MRRSLPLIGAFCAIFGLFVALEPAHAQIAPALTSANATISYQGLLRAADGQPVPDGDYQITVRLYSDESGSQEVWRDTYLTHVNSGVFNVGLGSGTQPLPPASQIERALWLGVQIGASDEMRPLTALSATPYALNVADKSITEKKIDADYVRSISINGEKLAGRAADLNIVTGDGLEVTVDPSTNAIMMRGSGLSRSGQSLGASVQGSNDMLPNKNHVGGLGNSSNWWNSLWADTLHTALPKGIVHSPGSGGALTSSAVSLNSEVTNVLPGANGGTGQSSYSKGDILYAASNGSTLSKRSVGAQGQVLQISSDGVPEWTSVVTPAADNSGSLGAPDKRFADLYLGPHSLHISDNSIETDLSIQIPSELTGTDQQALTLSVDQQPQMALTTDGVSVSGDLNTQGSISTDGSISTSGDLTVSGDANLNGALALSGDLATDGSLSSAGDVNVGGNLVPAADNTTTIGTYDNRVADLYLGPHSLHISDNSIETDLSIQIPSELTGTDQQALTLSVDQQPQMALTTDGVSVSGDLNTQGSISTDGSISTSGDLTVSGDANLNGALALSGDLATDGSLSSAGDVNVGGNLVPAADNTTTIGTYDNRVADLYLGPHSLHISDNSIETDLSIQTPSELTGTDQQALTLSVDQQPQMALTTDGVSVSGDLNTQGSISTDGSISTSGDLTVSGDANLNGALALSGDLATDGSLSSAGDVNVGGNLVPAADNTTTIGTYDNRVADLYLGPHSLHISDNSIETDLSIQIPSELTGTDQQALTLSVDQQPQMALTTDGVSVSGDLNTQGSISTDGSISTSGDLTVSGDANLNGALALSGDLATDGSLSSAGDVNVGGNLVPAADNTTTIGTYDNRVADLYLGPHSLHISDNSIETDLSIQIPSELTGTDQQALTLSVDQQPQMALTTDGVSVSGDLNTQGSISTDGSISTAGDLMASGVITSTGSISTDGSLASAGDVLVGGNLTPTVDNVTTVGTPDNRIADLYLGPHSMHVSGNANNMSDGIATDWILDLATTGASVGNFQFLLDNAVKMSLTRAGKLLLTGGVDMGATRIENLATPTANSDAATKSYVDQATAGLSTGVDAEAARATAAENVLTTNLAAEVTNRTNAVSAEATARAAADNTLQSNIDAKVSTVTASAPLSSSGGQNPNISLGTVPVANGGTGATSLTFNRILLGNGTAAISTVASTGNSGQVLTSTGSGTAPTWQTMISMGNTTNLSVGPTTHAAGGSGSYNTFMGHISGNGTGSSNTVVGGQTGISLTSGSANNLYGAFAGQNVTSGSSNILMGRQAGYTLSTTSDNTIIGDLAGGDITGSNNVALGSSALGSYSASAKNVSNNVAIGYSAGSSNLGNNNTFVGFQANASSTGLTNVTAIGSNASVSASNTIQLGNTSVTSVNTSGSYNSTVGYQIGGTTVLSQVGQGTLFLGFGTGVNDQPSSVTGAHNTFLGFNSGNANTVGNDNTFVGYISGQGNNGGFQNTFIGAKAGDQSAGNNIIANTFIGYTAGHANTTGRNNTALGNAADFGASNLQNATAVGAGAVVAASNAVQLGDASVTLVNTSGSYNTSTGYRIGGAATSGHYLRGNGSNYVDATISASDLPSLAGSYVDLTSAQTVGGTKSFSSTVNLATGSSTKVGIGISNTSGSQLANTLSNTIYSDANGIASTGFNWDANAGGHAASINNSSNNAAADGLGVWTRSTDPGTRILEVMSGTTSGVWTGLPRLLVYGDGRTEIIGDLIVNGHNVNSGIGYQVNGSAPSGQYLRGNGTNFVSGAIQASDLPSLTGSYIANGTSQQSSANFNISGNGMIGGSLGVGTTSPGATLEAKSSSTASILRVSRPNGNGDIEMNSSYRPTIYPAGPNVPAVGLDFQIRSAGNGILGLNYDAGADVIIGRSTIRGGSNVGIGPTFSEANLPTARLDVDGDITGRGNLTTFGAINANGILSVGGSIVIDGYANDRTITSDQSIDIVTQNGDVELNPASNVVHMGGGSNTADVYAHDYFGNRATFTRDMGVVDDGTYYGLNASITTSTVDVVNTVGIYGASSGTDDTSIGVQGAGTGTGGGLTIGGDFSAQNQSSEGTAIGVRASATGAVNNIAVEATDGDVYIKDSTKGIIMKDANGNCWRVTMNTNGTFSSTQLSTCPD